MKLENFGDARELFESTTEMALMLGVSPTTIRSRSNTRLKRKDRILIAGSLLAEKRIDVERFREMVRSEFVGSKFGDCIGEDGEMKNGQRV